MQNDTEQIILNTARKHFVQKGFAAARMQEIADEAQINKAMLHYYFRSKDKLYQEVVRRTLGQIFPKLATAMTSDGNVLERTKHIVETYIDTILEHPEIPLFIVSELSQKKVQFVEEIKKQAEFFPAMQVFLSQMLTEMQEGRIRQFPPVQLMLNILSMCVFPFMAKPAIGAFFEVSDTDFEMMMKERKAVIMDFVTQALKVE